MLPIDNVSSNSSVSEVNLALPPVETLPPAENVPNNSSIDILDVHLLPLPLNLNNSVSNVNETVNVLPRVIVRPVSRTPPNGNRLRLQFN